VGGLCAMAFTRAVALGWTASYAPIVTRRRAEPYGAAQERWHQQRRGRYVEFNLLVGTPPSTELNSLALVPYRPQARRRVHQIKRSIRGCN